jgi:hypothetical protein
MMGTSRRSRGDVMTGRREERREASGLPREELRGERRHRSLPLP